jgi:integrase
MRFSRLKENPARKGFVKDEQYAVLAACATELWLKGLLATAYEFGFRSGELTGLRVCQVDLKDRTICLDPGDTKNDEGRTIKMTTEVFDLLEQCIAGKTGSDYVFTRDGKPILDFRGAWWALCVKAGVGVFGPKDKRGKRPYQGLLFHDLRRSAVRNMVAAGIPDVVCMKISGHKSRSVFDRYNVVSTSDVAEATQKLENRKQRVKMELTPKLAPAIQVRSRKALKSA